MLASSGNTGDLSSDLRCLAAGLQRSRWPPCCLPSQQVRDCCRYAANIDEKGKGSPYSITERKVLELIPVLGSQPASDVSHKPGGRLPLLSARPAVTLATLKRAAANFAAW